MSKYEVLNRLEREKINEAVPEVCSEPEQMLKFSLRLPTRCPECNSVIFYIWGTLINGRLYTEVACKECGNAVYQAKNFE